MRRTLPLLLTATLLFAACSGSDSAADSSVDPTTATADTGATTPADGSTAPLPTNPDKPKVQVPDAIPTELQVKVLTPGSGPEAKAGDRLVVDYVGVRTKDGVEFDNSYDPRQAGVPASPFSFVLGQGAVIPGWDQGLVGAQAGAQIQLDIPSALAYGDKPSGDIIGANETLSFVIDVRQVIASPDAAGAPTDPGVPASVGATDTTFVDLTEGDGEALQPGQTGIIEYVLYRGDNLVQLESSWTSQNVEAGTAEGGFPGFVKGLKGMKVGGRRAIIVPPADGFGTEGNPQLGLPAGTDMIIVVDLLGIYGNPD